MKIEAWDGFDYAPITDRPKIRWPEGARLAFWVCPNVGYYEYLPPHNLYRDPWPRTPHPDARMYAYRDYGNRVGFWRLAETLSRHGVRASASVTTAVFEHLPDITEAMVDLDWEFILHGVYNTRDIYELSEAEEREYYARSKEQTYQATGKHLKGVFGPAQSKTPRTLDLLAEAGFVYHCDWFHDDQPFPLNVSKGKLISLPYSMQLNDAIVLPSYDSETFLRMIRDQFDTLYEEGSDNGRVMCIAMHPYEMGRPETIGVLDQALTHILSHDDVWVTTADQIADFYMDNYYEEVQAFLRGTRGRGGRGPDRAGGTGRARP